mgnify:CR=1 FL=1
MCIELTSHILDILRLRLALLRPVRFGVCMPLPGKTQVASPQSAWRTAACLGVIEMLKCESEGVAVCPALW